MLPTDDRHPLGGVALNRMDSVFEASRRRYVETHSRSQELTGHGGIAGFYDGVPMHWMRDWSMPFPFVVDSAHARALDGRSTCRCSCAVA